MTPKVQAIKKIDKLEFIKINDFCSLKDTLEIMKRGEPDWEKLFANHISNKGHIKIKNS